MTHLKTYGRAALLLGAATLIACGDKDAEVVSGDINVPEISANLLDNSYDVDSRTISADAAEAGLAYIGLDAKSDMVTWGNRTGDNGTYTYSDLRINQGNNETVTIDELMLVNVEEVAGTTTVGKISADDIVITSADGTLNVETYVAVNPNIDEFLGAMMGEDSLPSATAMNIQNVSGTTTSDTENGTVTLARLAYAIANDDNDGFLFLDDLSLDMTTEDFMGETTNSKISIDDVRVNGMPDEDLISGGWDSIMANAGEASIANPVIKSALIDDVSVMIDTMVFEMESFALSNEGDTEVESLMALAPTTLSFSGVPTDMELVQFYEGLQKLGYDSLTLSGGGRTVLDTRTDTLSIQDNGFVIDDMMGMSFDGTVMGWVAMEEAQKAAMAELGERPGDDDPDAQFEYMMREMEMGSVGMDELMIGDLRISIEDKSIMERAFKVAAEEQDSTPTKLKGLAKSTLGMGVMMAASSGVDSGIASEMVDALSDFIDTPESTLVIAINPAQPLSAASLEDPTTLTQESLGFTATVE